MVASTVGCLPDLIDSGEQGVLVPPGDAERMGREIGRLAADANLRHRMGKAARTCVEREQAEQVVAERIEQRYRSLLSGPTERCVHVGMAGSSSRVRLSRVGPAPSPVSG